MAAAGVIEGEQLSAAERVSAMEDLRAAFLALDRGRRCQAHVHVCRHALGVWEAYAHDHAPFEYVDSVVGMLHRVDTTLPRDAFESVRASGDRLSIAYRYQEPIAALQDQDLELPSHIEFAYYAIYNLFQRYVAGAPIDDWLIVNQALASEPDPERWRPLLGDALRHAGV